MKHSAAVQRGRRVHGLVRAVQRNQELVVGCTRRPEVDEPTAVRDAVGDDLEVAVPQHDPLGIAGGEDGNELRIGLPEHERRAGLDDPGLLRRDVGTGRTQVLDMVDAHVRDHCDRGVDHVGGIPGAAESDLDHRDIDRDVGEPGECHGGEDLEPARAFEASLGQRRFQLGDERQQRIELRVEYRLPVPGDAFVHPAAGAGW